MAPAVLASRAKGVKCGQFSAGACHVPTYDSCRLVTLTGLLLRVLPRLAHSSLRVRTRAGNVCVLGIYLLALHHSRGSLVSRYSRLAFLRGYHGTRARRQTAWESALCFTAVSQAQRRSACLRTRRGLAGDECGLQQRTYRSGWPRVGSLRHRPRRRHRIRSAPLSRCHLRRRSQRCSPSSLQCILDSVPVGAGSHAGQLAGLLNLQAVYLPR